VNRLLINFMTIPLALYQQN